MLPVVDRPVVQYVVEELVRSGIAMAVTVLVAWVAPNDTSSALYWVAVVLLAASLGSARLSRKRRY
jgi:UTP-glucose-1-phosphate uridylyltransferase